MDIRLFVAKGLNVSSTVIDENAYIFLEDRREIFQINEVGTYIWNLINGSVTTQDIISHCIKAFDDSESEISDGVMTFMESLEKGFMITTSAEKFEGVMNSE